MKTSIPKYLRREPAAQYVRETWGIRCSPKYLAKLAVVGGGPAFRKAGRDPLYEPPDLDDWARSKIGPRVSSTSELNTAPCLPSPSTSTHAGAGQRKIPGRVESTIPGQEENHVLAEGLRAGIERLPAIEVKAPEQSKRPDNTRGCK